VVSEELEDTPNGRRGESVFKSVLRKLEMPSIATQITIP
jgi:hypothetical protein